MRSKILVRTTLALCVAYLLVAMTPLRELIGRRDPALAAVFSPFLFNFSAQYATGEVLDFQIGMSRSAFIERLISGYAGKGDVTIDCRVTTADSVVPISQGLNPSSEYCGSQDICARLDAKRLGMRAYFQENSLKKIDLWFMRKELPQFPGNERLDSRP